MPSSDYTSAVGGGLKLKGSSSGIDKKKKKKKSSKPSTSEDKPSTDAPTTDLQKALANEDDVDKVEEVSEVKEYGKTEAQRRHEERRKKRVSISYSIHVGELWDGKADRKCCSSKNVSSAKESKRTRSAYRN